MTNSVSLLVLFSALFFPISVAAKQQQLTSQMQRILAAKSVYFEDKTGSDAVGAKALAELKRWRRFQVVPAREQADLVFRFSPDPGESAHVVFSGGQTGSVHGDGE